jgi:ABC-type polysaccharide/polyol phosphate export systems, permease component
MNRHLSHFATPTDLLRTLYGNRDLILQKAQREGIGLLQGLRDECGVVILQPVLMLAVYNLRSLGTVQCVMGIGGDRTKKSYFAIMLFMSMIVHGLFAVWITRSPSFITSNIDYVKNAVSPLEILALVAFCTSLFNSLIGLLVLMVAQLLINHALPWNAVYYPLVALPLTLGSMGFADVL